jgi:hypothetical protein
MVESPMLSPPPIDGETKPPGIRETTPKITGPKITGQMAQVTEPSAVQPTDPLMKPEPAPEMPAAGALPMTPTSPDETISEPQWTRDAEPVPQEPLPREPAATAQPEPAPMEPSMPEPTAETEPEEPESVAPASEAILPIDPEPAPAEPSMPAPAAEIPAEQAPSATITETAPPEGTDTPATESPAVATPLPDSAPPEPPATIAVPEPAPQEALPEQATPQEPEPEPTVAEPSPPPEPEPEPEPTVAEPSSPPEPVAEPPVTEPAAVTAASPPPPAPAPVAPKQPSVAETVLLEKGDRLLALGDIASARLLYETAAAGGSARGALLAGKTLDPGYLRSLGSRGVAGDPARAAAWYEKAAKLGDESATALLEALESR